MGGVSKWLDRQDGEETELSAQVAAERHAQDLVDDNSDRLLADSSGDALSGLIVSGAMPPDPTTKWQILTETTIADSVELHVLYSNGDNQFELVTTWQELKLGNWKILTAQRSAV